MLIKSSKLMEIRAHLRIKSYSNKFDSLLAFIKAISSQIIVNTLLPLTFNVLTLCNSKYLSSFSHYNLGFRFRKYKIYLNCYLKILNHTSH